MTENKEKKNKEQVLEKEISYKIEFRRFNKIAFVTGFLFILLAIVNIPFLYNPEMNQLTFNFSGKPTFALGGNLTFYIFVGFIPVLMGVIFILFSLSTSRKKVFLMANDGVCLYKNKEFVFNDKLQKIQLGKRHQRFVIWFSVAIMIFLVFLLLDYMNFLTPNFDITTNFFGIEYSVKAMLLLNVFFIIGMLLLLTLFPRRLCRIDTSEFYIKFNYSNLSVQRVSETPVDLPYIKPFQVLSRDQSLMEKGKKESIEVPNNYPEVLKQQMDDPKFKHLPLISIICNMGLFLIIFLPQFLPDFFIGGFTFRIEYFLSVMAFYFTVRTLQNSWYSHQIIQQVSGQSNWLIKRSNRIFGDSVEYFANIDTIERTYKPRSPNFFEYIFLFIPIMQIVWLIASYCTFGAYFFTQNPFTLIYILIIVGSFFFLAIEYIFPQPLLSFTPHAQNPDLKNTERYTIYFPAKQILINLPFKQKKFFQTTYKGFFLILIPVIFSLLWILLSNLGLMPPISETIF